MNVYEIVTETIIKKLEQGTVPWRQPWSDDNGPVAWKTQRPYNGINRILLADGEYATFNQIKESGGMVKKGERSSMVVFWRMVRPPKEGKDEEPEVKPIPLLRFFKVFEINTQCTGLKSKRENKEKIQHEPITEAGKIVADYKAMPKLKHASGQAYYNLASDYISVPPIVDYKKPQEYYSTLFHEMVHSTGHQSRLDRKLGAAMSSFIGKSYSKEELIAEIGAAMLCGVSGIESATIDNSASYIAHWLATLKNDSKMIVHAAGAAQKAADYIRGIRRDEVAQEAA